MQVPNGKTKVRRARKKERKKEKNNDVFQVGNSKTERLNLRARDGGGGRRGGLQLPVPGVSVKQQKDYLHVPVGKTKIGLHLRSFSGDPVPSTGRCKNRELRN